MIKCNIILFLRNIKRDKTSFLINLIGLSTGLACTILIYFWVNDERSIDKFHEKDSQLYQVMQNYEMPDGIVTWDYTSVLLAEALVEEMPEVDYAVAVNNFFNWSNKEGLLSGGHNHIKAKGIFAGKDFFDVFSYKLVQGNKKQVLKDKNTILLSEGLAKKIFNSTENIIGKTVEWEYRWFKKEFQISGIFETPPSNSTLQFEFILNIGTLIEIDPNANEWGGGYAYTYIVLNENTKNANLNEKITDFYRSKRSNRKKSTLFIQQYSQKYLNGKYENGVQSGGRIMYVRLFSVIAILILIIACINFMNLTTAKASQRMKEVGIRKLSGAKRIQLIGQFLGESIILTMISYFLAAIFIELLLPTINNLTGKELEVSYSNPQLTVGIICVLLFTGIISGSYPAFYLSGFNPAKVLKGKLNTSFGELWIRKGLVIFQFTLSVIFIVCFLVINKQIELIQTKNLGYEKDNVICFKRGGRQGDNYTDLISRLKNVPGVVNASSMFGSILKVPLNGGFSWEGSKKEDSDQVYPYLRGDYDLIETFGIKVKEGRSFSRKFGNEESKIILSEAAVKMVGIKNPIGKNIKWGSEVFQIIGVVRDFHCGSLHSNLKPTFIGFSPNRSDFIVRIEKGTERNTIDRIKKVYKEFYPHYPFEFTFLNDDYQALYESENKVASLSKYFSAIAIIISCLGLFGLAAFTVERRRKEIGVRKVHGSSSFGVMKLVSSDFSKIVIISIVISLPTSYLIMKNWLDGFAYRIALSWGFFAGAGFIALLIAWLTVGSQALKAAKANPATILKYE